MNTNDNTNMQALTETETEILALLRRVDIDTHPSLITVLTAIVDGYNMTPEERAAADAEFMAKVEADNVQRRLASIPQPTPEELENRAIRDAWRKLPEDDRLLDGSNANGTDALELLSMHVMNQLFARLYLGKIQLYIESGLSDLFEDIKHMIQTGIDALPTGYGSELIGGKRE